MSFLLSGYYGFGNAGDEAVLAAILEALGARVPPGTSCVVTSGDPARTRALHGGGACTVAAVPRGDPRRLVPAIKQCDVFISGGGSLLQDVTSLRNVVYYTSLMRLARLMGKPVMVYAQGVGPLRQALSRKLAGAAVAGATVITVRDPASKELLQQIGVRRDIEVTADPVWALGAGDAGAFNAPGGGPVWGVSLRSWVGSSDGAAAGAAVVAALREAARGAGATLRFFAMQPASDGPLMAQWSGLGPAAIIGTDDLHPRQMMARVAHCDLMIAMRLHALIFAAAQGVPCVAINYDPKVAALAGQIGAPVLQNLSRSELARLPEAIAAAQPLPVERRHALRRLALRSADLAAALPRS